MNCQVFEDIIFYMPYSLLRVCCLVFALVLFCFCFFRSFLPFPDSNCQRSRILILFGQLSLVFT